jgi:pimeloyl-ACP methyl ester carboxylesterase
MQKTDIPEIDAATFHTDVQYIEALWRRVPIGEADMPLIDTGSDKGEPLVFVPILEHLEFVYARQLRAFGQRRRVIMYRRHETRTQPVGLVERAEELRKVLDALGLERVDLVGHGDAAMVLFEFAARYPQRCHSLIIVAQGADYQIAPHPFIWLLHELFVRLPVEYILPAWFLRRSVINYIVANGPVSSHLAAALTQPRRRAGRERSASPAAPTRPAAAPINLAVPAHLAPARGGPSINRDTCPPGRVPTAFPHDQYTANQAQTGSPGSVLPRSLIEEQFRKIAHWPFVYKYSVLPVIHYFDMRSRLNSLTMPVLLINRANDALSPEEKTRWLAGHLPNCTGYHVVAGGERFFMYSQAGTVNGLIEEFLTSRATAAEN